MTNFYSKNFSETFDFLKEEENANDLNLSVKERKYIIIIGVGSAGYQNIKSAQIKNLKGVDFAICDTHFEDDCKFKKFDLEDLFSTGKIADEAIRDFLQENNPKMVIITGGIGGNTSSIAMPLIAEIAKEMDILTLAFVTEPFKFEGAKRQQQARRGIEALKEVVDCCFVDTSFEKEENSNSEISWLFKKSNLTFADNVEQITNLICNSYPFIDLRDVACILKQGKVGIIKTETAFNKENLETLTDRILKKFASSEEFNRSKPECLPAISDRVLEEIIEVSNSSELPRIEGLVIVSYTEDEIPKKNELDLILGKIEKELNMDIILELVEDNSKFCGNSITIITAV